MAPSIVLEDGRPRLVVGSAGSIRLRAAIVQIVVNVVDHGLSAEEAIDAPRVHLDEEVLQLEGGIEESVAADLEEAGLRRQPLDRSATSTSAAPRRSPCAPTAGSRRPAIPRRGGAGVVVGG